MKYNFVKIHVVGHTDSFVYWLYFHGIFAEKKSVDDLMETKGGKKKSSSSSSRIQYEAPLGYIIEDVRPNGGIEKFRTAAYSNVRKINFPFNLLLLFRIIIIFTFI